MIDWVKEVNSEKYLKSLIQFLLKSTEEIPTKPTDKGWNQIPLDLSLNLHHAPYLNKDVNKISETHGEQDKISHLLRQDKTRQDREPPSQQAKHIDRDGWRLMLEKFGTTH
jgi:hypothetical protein